MKKNKKISKKRYWLQLVGLMIIGGIFGLSSYFILNKVEDTIHFSINWNFILHTLSLLLLGLAILFTILSRMFLKKCHHFKLDQEDEDDFINANKNYDLSTATNTLITPLLFAHMGLLPFVETTAFLYFFILTLFLALFILSIIQAHKIIKELDYFFSIDNVSPYDEKSVKTFTKQLDEGAKAIAHEASFLAFQKVLALLYSLTILFSLLTIAIDIQPGYLLLTMVITVTAMILHYIEGWKLEYRKEKQENETNRI